MGWLRRSRVFACLVRPCPCDTARESDERERSMAATGEAG